MPNPKLLLRLAGRLTLLRGLLVLFDWPNPPPDDFARLAALNCVLFTLFSDFVEVGLNLLVAALLPLAVLAGVLEPLALFSPAVRALRFDCTEDTALGDP